MLNNIVKLIRDSNENTKGLRIIQKVIKEGFSEYVDINNITLQEFVNAELEPDCKEVKIETKEIEIKIVDIHLLIDALKSFTGTSKGKRIIKVDIVTDNSQIKGIHEKVNSDE